MNRRSHFLKICIEIKHLVLSFFPAFFFEEKKQEIAHIQKKIEMAPTQIQDIIGKSNFVLDVDSITSIVEVGDNTLYIPQEERISKDDFVIGDEVDNSYSTMIEYSHHPYDETNEDVENLNLLGGTTPSDITALKIAVLEDEIPSEYIESVSTTFYRDEKSELIKHINKMFTQSKKDQISQFISSHFLQVEENESLNEINYIFPEED